VARPACSQACCLTLPAGDPVRVAEDRLHCGLSALPEGADQGLCQFGPLP